MGYNRDKTEKARGRKEFINMASERIIFMANRSNAEDIYPETVVPEYTRDYILEGDMLFEAHKIAEYLQAQTVRIDPEDRFVGRVKFTGDVRGDLFRRAGAAHSGTVGRRFYKQPFENLATKDHQHANARFVDMTISETGLQVSRS